MSIFPKKKVEYPFKIAWM